MRSRFSVLLVLLTGVSVFLFSCSENTTKEVKKEQQFTYTVAFDDNVYGFTNDEVTLDDIDKLIGEASGVVSPRVTKNGQIGCNVSECKAPPGTKFYSLKTVDSKEAIAVKVQNGKNNYLYFKCVFIDRL